MLEKLTKWLKENQALENIYFPDLLKKVNKVKDLYKSDLLSNEGYPHIF